MMVEEEEKDESVLDQQGEHYTLCADQDSIAAQAGINVSFIHQPMSQHCGAVEVAYVTKLFQHKTNGIVYVGKEDAGVRMMAIAGACIRNFIDARMVTMKDVLQGLKDGEIPNPDVALIPNFCISADDRGVAAWEMTHLLGWLYDREFSEKMTFLSVSSMKHVELQLGALITTHLTKKFIQI